MAYWVPGGGASFVNDKQGHWLIPGTEAHFLWESLYDPSPDVYIQMTAWANAMFYEPEIAIGRRMMAPVMSAQGDMLTPVILLGSTVGPIGLAPVSNARMVPPSISLTQKVNAAQAKATAKLFVPSLKIGWYLTPVTPMGATGAVLVPVVKRDSTQVAPVLSAGGQVLTPVVRSDASIVPPRVAATGILFVPVVNAVNFQPTTTVYNPGTWQTGATYTYTIPVGAQKLDLVAVGGGGGSSGSGFGANNGALAGSWSGVTINVSSLGGAKTLTVVCGAGGAFGGPNGGDGGAGNPSTVSWATTPLVTANGPVVRSSSGSATGNGPGNFVFNGITYVGGPNVGGDTNGGSPGGGGGGRQAFFSGGWSGADGGVWIRAY